MAMCASSINICIGVTQKTVIPVTPYRIDCCFYFPIKRYSCQVIGSWLIKCVGTEEGLLSTAVRFKPNPGIPQAPVMRHILPWKHF